MKTRIFASIKADLGYIFEDIREFGFSWSRLKANLRYMTDNLTDPMREGGTR